MGLTMKFIMKTLFVVLLSMTIIEVHCQDDMPIMPPVGIRPDNIHPDNISFFRNSPAVNNYCLKNISVDTVVVDTLKAQQIFEENKRPILLAAYEKGCDKLERCRTLCKSEIKKTTEPEDMYLLKRAYKIYLTRKYNVKEGDIAEIVKKTGIIPSFKLGMPLFKHRYYMIKRELIGVNKDVLNGKLTAEVKDYLSSYIEFLADSLHKEKEKIDKGWSEFLSCTELPHKIITITKPNPWYRGRIYMWEDLLDIADGWQQEKNWEFLKTEEREFHSESYPNKIGYICYKAAPNYRVTYQNSFDGYKLKEVYDKSGKLVYVPSLTRGQNTSEFKEIKRLVYLKDYTNNKYGIKSKTNHTQEYLKLRLCREKGLELTPLMANFAYGVGAYIGLMESRMISPKDRKKVRKMPSQMMMDESKKLMDKTGENYIDQLEMDHAADFGYIYMIERLSAVSFRVVYINKKTLEPSHCAVITYRTGDKPYTARFSTKLAPLPHDIPPVIKE